MNVPPVLVRLPDGNTRRVHAVDLPEQFDQEIQSWDLAFKDLDTSDYVAGGVWGVKGADRYLLDQVRDRLGFPETVAAIKKMTLTVTACFVQVTWQQGICATCITRDV